MAKKRKSDANKLDEVDRTMYSTFTTAANSLSQLYTHAMDHQKLTFQAGERHALEKLHQWILVRWGEGSPLTAADIIAYLQNELEGGMGDPSVPHICDQPPNLPNVEALATPFVPEGLQEHQSAHYGPHQASNVNQPSAVRSLQPRLFAGCSHHPINMTSFANVVRCTEANITNVGDCCMDINADGAEL